MLLIKINILFTVHGGWSVWSPWSQCSQSCGTSQRYRKRSCSHPKPSNGGRNCDGPSLEIEACRMRPCRNEHTQRSGTVCEIHFVVILIKKKSKCVFYLEKLSSLHDNCKSGNIGKNTSVRTTRV